MTTQQDVKIDERTVAVLHASNTWGLNVMIFGLFIDIIYRTAVLHEQAWDLFALIGLCGAINTMYLARHKVLRQVFNWKVAILVAVTALVVGVVSVFFAMNKIR
jgi:uncharacterized membrane protein YsdA (DUF1294 family)